ncbi:MAG: cytochrome c [Gemmataceae bacterium]|nr:cytochrome c [Gemmataceae bacterium]
MAEQPKIKMHTVFSFFEDGRGNRPPVEGTVARGMLQENDHMFTGLKEGGTVAAWKNQNPAKEAMPAEVAKAPYFATFPFPVDEELIKRGQERFNIYCAVCHGRTGAGNGMIVQRGFLPPPSFHVDNSRGLKYLTGAGIPLLEAPEGYYFQVITHGFGAMASYSAQVNPRDRWAIIAYIRSLQEAFGKSPARADAGKEKP